MTTTKNSKKLVGIWSDIELRLVLTEEGHSIPTGWSYGDVSSYAEAMVSQGSWIPDHAKKREVLIEWLKGKLTNKPQSIRRMTDFEDGTSNHLVCSLALGWMTKVNFSLAIVSPHPTIEKDRNNGKQYIRKQYQRWPEGFEPKFVHAHFETPLSDDGSDSYVESQDGWCPACGNSEIEEQGGHGECHDDECGYTWTYDENTNDEDGN